MRLIELSAVPILTRKFWVPPASGILPDSATYGLLSARASLIWVDWGALESLIWVDWVQNLGNHYMCIFLSLSRLHLSRTYGTPKCGGQQRRYPSPPLLPARWIAPRRLREPRRWWSNASNPGPAHRWGRSWCPSLGERLSWPRSGIFTRWHQTSFFSAPCLCLALVDTSRALTLNARLPHCTQDHEDMQKLIIYDCLQKDGLRD